MEQSIREEHEQFLYHLDELENIGSVYNIEDMCRTRISYVYRR